MINKLINFLFKKEIILYTEHRQTLPLLQNKENRSGFFFINMSPLWKLIPFRSYDKRKYRIMYLVLSIIHPKYIIDINWISPYNSLYKLWTKNNNNSKFVVIQHGSYVGGVVTDVAHRYTKCDIFLTWGEYFTKLFSHYNSGKKVEIINYGNTIYNGFNRDDFHYRETSKIQRILIAPSGVKDERLDAIYTLYKKLKELDFEVSIKLHNFQERRFGKIEGIPTDSRNPFAILKDQEYDLIVTDHSSLMLDAIFFKNKVLFFSKESSLMPAYTNNQYLKYLDNQIDNLLNVTTKEEVFSFLSIDKQERLLSSLVFVRSNSLINLS